MLFLVIDESSPSSRTLVIANNAKQALEEAQSVLGHRGELPGSLRAFTESDAPGSDRYMLELWSGVVLDAEGCGDDLLALQSQLRAIPALLSAAASEHRRIAQAALKMERTAIWTMAEKMRAEASEEMRSRHPIDWRHDHASGAEKALAKLIAQVRAR